METQPFTINIAEWQEKIMTSHDIQIFCCVL